MEQIINQCKMPFELATGEGQQALSEISDAIESHNKAVDKLLADVETLKADVELNPGQNRDTEAAKLRQRKAALLHEELMIRLRINDFLERVRDIELGAFVDKAIADRQAAEERVRKQIEKLGFIDDEHAKTLATIVSLHPAVNDAISRIDATLGTNFHSEPMASNAAAIEKCRAEMESLRGEALKGLGV